MTNNKVQKMTILAMMIAMDVVLSPLFRVEGIAPMSSVMNVIAAVLMGPIYGTVMALACGILRMILFGIPPLALTGAVFGAFLAGVGYKWMNTYLGAIIGEFIGTGLIGSLLSYPIMVWFTGSAQGMYWFVYTPWFILGALSGSLIAYLVLVRIDKVPYIQRVKKTFG
ncbi:MULTISPECIES: energy coupling factor transporter S component ThiW [Lactobacillales]|uniref:energy coupling factor transporter S component ThiW n=1 Tax=Lactobacillales TaxID=186826 RepID=UPI0006605DA3|nr:energy coupling factor transporter S component ThiW [Carnobacterium sp. 1290_CSPC]